LSNIKNICVYTSSSNELDKKYYETAKELGVLMAQEGYNLIYGGGNLGMMGVLAQAVKDFGAKVFGVLPEKLHQLGVGDVGCDELHITKCMRTRKEKLDNLSDAVIALAGGFGTLEELSEMIVQKQLGYSEKAIVILNTDGFYDNLLKFFEELVAEKFAATDMKTAYYVAKTPQEAINYLKNMRLFILRSKQK
jgi:cytokinin riboside 5'-monophosphate phosphoribohydrolase